jgi:hypothetical protein
VTCDVRINYELTVSTSPRCDARVTYGSTWAYVRVPRKRVDHHSGQQPCALRGNKEFSTEAPRVGVSSREALSPKRSTQWQSLFRRPPLPPPPNGTLLSHNASPNSFRSHTHIVTHSTHHANAEPSSSRTIDQAIANTGILLSIICVPF